MAEPADPNDGSLLSSIFINADDAAYENAREMLGLMNLPNAAEGEFFSGPNVDRLYLNTAGLVVSFVYRRPTLRGMLTGLFKKDRHITAPVFDARTVVDDRILQPLYQVDLSEQCCLEIIPGIYQDGVKPQHLADLSQELKARKVKFYNPQQEFVGIVRAAQDDESLVVVANRRVIKPIDKVQNAGSGCAERQERVYGTLHGEFQHAFATGAEASVSDVFCECAKIESLPKKDPARILNCHWMEAAMQSPRRQEIQKAACNLHRRLSQ
ncbi:MAG: hypothetical protein DI626_04620 [Micavibrio aeruginosavorus]|uniref:Uncharacterized protein n=1 Tax=Micavibrio aeruginosavorus TaxID=349221 RepID=A0A2W5A1R5_9BACT|nr:MAG: hypothetical protein DI626_04620 [Micavibrio aeruginosavorus]